MIKLKSAGVPSPAVHAVAPVPGRVSQGTFLETVSKPQLLRATRLSLLVRGAVLIFCLESSPQSRLCFLDYWFRLVQFGFVITVTDTNYKTKKTFNTELNRGELNCKNASSLDIKASGFLQKMKQGAFQGPRPSSLARCFHPSAKRKNSSVQYIRKANCEGR